MAAIEWRVITEVMRSGDVDTAVRLGLNNTQFKGDYEAGQIWDFILAHWNNPDTYRQMPLKSTVVRLWPGVQWTSSSDGGRLATLIREMQSRAVDADVRSLASLFQELVDNEDSIEAVRVMKDHLNEVLYNNTAVAGFGVEDILDGFIAAYERAQRGENYGIPYPWDCLTRDTLGKNRGDFILMYARAKQMKTWILLINALEDFMKHGRRVLVWSKEMFPDKMKLRAGSILGKVDYQCVKNGNLPPHLFEQAKAGMIQWARLLKKGTDKKHLEDAAKHDIPAMMFLCGNDAPTSLEELSVAVDTFNPHIAYLDSYHKMECAKAARLRQDHEQQRALAESLKESAMNWKIPVVGTFHANTKGEATHGENMGDVSRTDAASREADLIIRVIYRKGKELDEDDYEGYWREEDARRGKRDLNRAAPRLKINPKLKSDKTPSKVTQHFERQPRLSADIFMMLPGNREGVLSGFQIRAVPGYKWDVIRDSISPNEVKKLLKEDEENASAATQAPAKKGRPVSPNKSPEPKVGVGQGFANLPKRGT